MERIVHPQDDYYQSRPSHALQYPYCDSPGSLLQKDRLQYSVHAPTMPGLQHHVVNDRQHRFLKGLVLRLGTYVPRKKVLMSVAASLEPRVDINEAMFVYVLSPPGTGGALPKQRRVC